MSMPSPQREQKQPVYGGRAVFEVRARLDEQGPAPAAPAEPRPVAAEPVAPSSGPALDDEWRRWIAENLLISNSPESLLAVLKSCGFPEPLAAREIRMAQESPYLRGCDLLRSRLRKRDWILSIYRKLNRLHPEGGEVDRRHRPSRDEFLREYYAANRPVIITGMMEDWPALRKWTLDYLAQTFGDREVQVQMNRNAGDAGAQYEMNHERFSGRLKFGDFVQGLRTAGVTNDFYLTANNNSSNRQVLPELWDDIVQIPEYLRADQPGGFFWMGPAGTVTPFHHDLTNNFMAQVMGRKLVKIAPSWDSPLMRNHLHCFSQVDGRVTPASPQPDFDQPQILECVLHPGEILFLPIGCWHYVQGLDITITVSFTNFIFDNDFSSYYTCFCPV
jgi:Cupin-like domain